MHYTVYFSLRGSEFVESKVVIELKTQRGPFLLAQSLARPNFPIQSIVHIFFFFFFWIAMYSS